MIRLSAFADEISQDPAEQVDVLAQHGINFIEFRAIHGTNVLDLSESQHADLSRAAAGTRIRIERDRLAHRQGVDHRAV